MKTIIAGSRDITDFILVEMACVECGWEITEVVSGGARGVDALGEKWAWAHRVPIQFFSANWTNRGKSAGPIRNNKMAHYADALIAITNGSRGTAHMIQVATTRGLKVFVVNV